MNPYYADDAVTLSHGDALEVMRAMPAASVDAVCTDPPYALTFMGREWDRFTPAAFAEFSRAWAAEAYRVLKPGGHLLAFGGTRTWHRLVCGIEDAGFEIRDTITWLYGSGFPKSLDVSKAIDKAAGAEREVVGLRLYGDGQTYGQRAAAGRSGGAMGAAVERGPDVVTAPATDDARRWQGWGTALKPASEPIVVARKPLAGTVAQTVQAHGTGALNIDACRVAGDVPTATRGRNQFGVINDDGWQPSQTGQRIEPHSAGRWPSNVVLSHAATPDGADLCGGRCVPGCPVAELDAQSGVSRDGVHVGHNRDASQVANQIYGARRKDVRDIGYGSSGGASRFFPTFRYEAKAPSSERPRDGDVAHPTVKPLDLMRWLVRLVTPPGGLVLDPFAGSGTTGEACVLEGFRCHLIELEATHLPLIVKRLAKPMQLGLFGTEA